MQRPSIAISTVALIIATLTLHRLDAAEVCDTSEAVEGVFLQQMVEHGHLLFPLASGREPMYKPPLFHWTAAALDRLAGADRVTTANLRRTSALYAVAGGALTTAVASRLVSSEVGWLSGLILAGSYQYIREGRSGTVNMALTFCEALTLCAFLLWLAARSEQRPRDAGSQRLRQYGFAAALGLGVLAKGPVGAILPLGAIVIFLVAERRWADAAELASLRPAILAVAIGSSWYVACLVGGRYDFLARQLGSENVGRFFGTLGTMRAFYYLTPLLLNSAPFSVLVPFAVAAALRSSPRGDRRAPDDEAPMTSAVVRLFAIFWLVTVVFFALASYKRRVYLLPLWPAAAVLLAWWFRAVARRARSRRLVHTVGLVWLAAVGVNFFYIPHREIRDCGGASAKSSAMQIAQLVAPGAALYVEGDDVDMAPLLFYLDRNTLEIDSLAGAPPGYVIVSAARWAAEGNATLGLEPLLSTGSGGGAVVVVRSDGHHVGKQ